MKNRKPNINYFKVCGCIAYVLDIDNKRAKLGSKAIKSIFIGYSLHSKACLDRRVLGGPWMPRGLITQSTHGP